TAVPSCVALAEYVTFVLTTLTRFLPIFLYETSRFFVTLMCAAAGPLTTACVSTEPAAFGVPAPGVYGVHSDVQRDGPAGAVSALVVNVAERSFAPNVERAGFDVGTSGGGRQVTIFATPAVCSTPVVGTTYIGMSRVCPAAARCMSQIADGVPPWMQDASLAFADGESADSEIASSSPVSGSTAPPRSAADAVATTSPSFEPSAGGFTV